MLKKAGIYNDISPELMPVLPKKGTVVTYEYIAMKPDANRDKLNPRGMMYLPSRVDLPCTSTFFDKIKGEWIDVGLVERVAPSGEIEFQRINLTPDNNAGLSLAITIGSSGKNNDLYQYMELASFVEIDGKVLPQGKAPMFRRVDTEKDALARKAARDKKYEAYNTAKGFDADALNRAAILIGCYNSTVSEGTLREAVEAFAEKNPEQFFDLVVNDAHGDAKAAMKMAIHLGICEVGGGELKWADSKQAILTLTSDSDPAIQFANYIIGDPKGTQIYGVIKDQISKKNAKKKK